jgi:hypothetical protein
MLNPYAAGSRILESRIVSDWSTFIYQHQYSTGYVVIEADCYSGGIWEHGEVESELLFLAGGLFGAYFKEFSFW